MADSTAVIDATSDTTAIIIIDSTASNVENMTATVANSLVEDFAAGMGPIAFKCDKLAGQTNGIRDLISGMTPSKPDFLDMLLANAMNAAYQSSAWATAAGAADAIKGVLDRCEYFQEAADKVAKYADPSKFIAGLAKSAAKKRNKQ